MVSHAVAYCRNASRGLLAIDEFLATLAIVYISIAQQHQSINRSINQWFISYSSQGLDWHIQIQ